MLWTGLFSLIVVLSSCHGVYIVIILAVIIGLRDGKLSRRSYKLSLNMHWQHCTSTHISYLRFNHVVMHSRRTNYLPACTGALHWRELQTAKIIQWTALQIMKKTSLIYQWAVHKWRRYRSLLPTSKIVTHRWGPQEISLIRTDNNIYQNIMIHQHKLLLYWKPKICCLHFIITASMWRRCLRCFWNVNVFVDENNITIKIIIDETSRQRVFFPRKSR